MDGTCDEINRFNNNNNNNNNRSKMYWKYYMYLSRHIVLIIFFCKNYLHPKTVKMCDSDRNQIFEDLTFSFTLSKKMSMSLLISEMWVFWYCKSWWIQWNVSLALCCGCKFMFIHTNCKNGFNLLIQTRKGDFITLGKKEQFYFLPWTVFCHSQNFIVAARTRVLSHGS